jgi:hypothetical protein
MITFLKIPEQSLFCTKSEPNKFLVCTLEDTHLCHYAIWNNYISFTNLLVA